MAYPAPNGQVVLCSAFHAIFAATRTLGECELKILIALAEFGADAPSQSIQISSGKLAASVGVSVSGAKFALRALTDRGFIGTEESPRGQAATYTLLFLSQTEPSATGSKFNPVAGLKNLPIAQTVEKSLPTGSNFDPVVDNTGLNFNPVNTEQGQNLTPTGLKFNPVLNKETRAQARLDRSKSLIDMDPRVRDEQLFHVWDAEPSQSDPGKMVEVWSWIHSHYTRHRPHEKPNPKNPPSEKVAAQVLMIAEVKGPTGYEELRALMHRNKRDKGIWDMRPGSFGLYGWYITTAIHRILGIEKEEQDAAYGKWLAQKQSRLQPVAIRQQPALDFDASGLVNRIAEAATARRLG